MPIGIMAPVAVVHILQQSRSFRNKLLHDMSISPVSTSHNANAPRRDRANTASRIGIRIVEKETENSPFDWETCAVESHHIDEMFRRFDSGMCDLSTSNAVALALAEKWGAPVRVFQYGSCWMADFQPVGRQIVPARFATWLDRIMVGLPVEPIVSERAAVS
ncbi:MAG: hypothetical protein P1V20_06510 [Verrucomicrobiales bacterium]|nr:hypothetical protein [Verrucomicrobiales bacterium]